MKTLQTTISNQVTESRSRVRFVLTLAGIVTAVLCSMALWQEARSSERIDASAPRLLKTSKVVVTGLIGEVKTWL